MATKDPAWQSYEARLAEWKANHGAPDPASEHSMAELKMFAEEKMDEGKSWCIFCDSRLPIRELRLITLKIDPYTQEYDGESDYIPRKLRVRACPKCFVEHYEYERQNSPTGSAAAPQA